MSFMAEFLGQLKRAGNSVGKTATDAAESTMLKVSELDVESDLENHYRELGRRAYMASKGKLSPSDVEVVITEIDVCMDKLQELRDRRDDMRRKRREGTYGSPENTQYCDVDDGGSCNCEDKEKKEEDDRE